MGVFEKGTVRIQFEEAGSGFPLLVIPGGGLNSTVLNLRESSPFNPMEELKAEARRLVQAENARTRIEHTYVQTPAGDVHRAATLVRDAARNFMGSYRAWIEPYLAQPEP